MTTKSKTLPGPTTAIGLPSPKQGMVLSISVSSNTILADFWKVSHLLSNRKLRKPRKGSPSASELKKIAEQNPPPPEWYEGEEERPF